MKTIKYLFVLTLIISLGISAWFYYPQYQINKMKKSIVETSSNGVANVSYIDYFRHTKATKLYHLALGDSIIRGFGAKQNEDFVYQFSTELGKQINKEIQIQNEGINGMTSGYLNKLVQEGKFDEEIKKSDIVTMNVGGNDILQVASDGNFQSILKSIEQLKANYSTNLDAIASRIKMLNANATIVFLELYNPFSLTDQVYPLADKLLPKWNLLVYEIANNYSSTLVVETTKVINGENLNNLSQDGVHPNSEGYMAISEQLIFQLTHQYRKEDV
ncbi:GDSL-type esterase/lipase family protein [Neobacillus sp. FSL H8-0543]|uniref:GDSL-type esterase/lipase family protein n=1 Tax=Neobacillus sp. FSL H8-0543 TaxID=2954672 RepID=UPI0031585EB8